MDNFPLNSVHPILYKEFQEKCKQLDVKKPIHLVAAMMRAFILECDLTNNNPKILVGSTLVEKIPKEHIVN